MIDCLTKEDDLRMWVQIISTKTDRCHTAVIKARPDGGVEIDDLIFDGDEVADLIEVLEQISERPRTNRAEAVEHERTYRGWCAPKDYVPTYGDESKPEVQP